MDPNLLQIGNKNNPLSPIKSIKRSLSRKNFGINCVV